MRGPKRTDKQQQQQQQHNNMTNLNSRFPYFALKTKKSLFFPLVCLLFGLHALYSPSVVMYLSGHTAIKI